MSPRLGQVYFAPRRQGQFLGPLSEDGREYSDETAQIIDEEVRRIIDEQYDRALRILKANRELLDRTAQNLLVDEVIEGDKLERLASSVQVPGNTDLVANAGPRVAAA
jgi:cell division protease FtsH